MKLPAIQFYPADWRKDPAVQALNFHDRGVWFEILCLMHESSERGVLLLNGIPMPEDALARMLGLDKQILTTTLTTLLTYGAAKRRDADGAIYSSRMVKDEKIIQIRREAGKKGGNPLLLNQNPTTGVNQIPTPSSSSSSSSSNINTPPDGVSQEVWQEFVKHRKTKKASVTPLVIKGIEVQAKKAGWSLEDALKETVIRNWQSFNADWVKDQPKQSTLPTYS
jgi:hypothetical protein